MNGMANMCLLLYGRREGGCQQQMDYIGNLLSVMLVISLLVAIYVMWTLLSFSSYYYWRRAWYAGMRCNAPDGGLRFAIRCSKLIANLCSVLYIHTLCEYIAMFLKSNLNLAILRP